MGNAGVIELSLHFSALARRPDLRRLGRRWDVCIEVDGELHVREEGSRHVVPAAAGLREIKVWFRGAGLAVLGRFFRFGLRSVRVDVPAGGAVRLLYEGSTLWHLGGRASLHVE